MKLLNKYIEMSENIEILKQYAETGTGKYGKMFKFINTNYRLISSIITNYNTFKVIDGIDRANWELNTNHGQENLKQHTVNMLQMKLFSKDERIYYKTQKGETLEKISDEYEENEKWLLVYMLILDAYFENCPNYILERTKEIIEDFQVYNNDIKNITEVISKFIVFSDTMDIYELFEQEYIYMDTFFLPFEDNDFLALYNQSNKEEKEELFEYVKENYRNRDYKCILSKKYKPSGVYNRNMVRDNAKLLYITSFINNTNFRDFSDFTNKIVDYYKTIEPTIDTGKLKQFIFKHHKPVFEMIYINALRPEILDENRINDLEATAETIAEIEKSKIDDTTSNNIEQLNKISGILKKKAKERVEYKCELEELCTCESHYFTSKETKKNYVEIHHFIPREFSNDFEKTIEVIENYVSLCPRCHRMIHKAVDRERDVLIAFLFNKRKGSLDLKGLKISLDEIKKYYKIEG